jgi:hypothetical protein
MADETPVITRKMVKSLSYKDLAKLRILVNATYKEADAERRLRQQALKAELSETKAFRSAPKVSENGEDKTAGKRSRKRAAAAEIDEETATDAQ